MNALTTPRSRASRFEAVLDSRKRKVRGLWRRGDRYYGQLRVDLGNGCTSPRRVALQANTLEEARAALAAEKAKEKVNRKNGDVRSSGPRSKFEECAANYLGSQTFARKKLSTQRSEQQAIVRWKQHAGGIRIDKISVPMIHTYRQKRLAQLSRKAPNRGLSERTVNLDVIALRQVMRFAIDGGLIQELPKVRALKQRPPERRPLLTNEQFSQLLAAASEETTKNSELFRYYLRFLALTGAREKEALRIKWADVDFEKKVSRSDESRTLILHVR